MKKIIYLSAALAVALCLAGCMKDSDSTGTATVTTSDVFIINAGNEYNQIDGSVTAISLADTTVYQGVFKTANSRSLGSTPNDAVIYGEKMYIVATGSNTVEVVDKNSLKSIIQLSTTSLLGDEKGNSPRRLVAGNGNVYVSTYGGCVAAIDTATFVVKHVYEAGSYPEGLALSQNGYLYVANSDWGMGQNPSIMCFDTSSSEVRTSKKNVMNPQTFAYCQNNLYCLDYGSYDENSNQVGAGIKVCVGDSVSHIADATLMAPYAKTSTAAYLYLVNAPYGAQEAPTYKVFTPGVAALSKGNLSTFIEDGPKYPAAIGVDPNSGDVYITAYNEGEYGADYSAEGYVNIYDSNGNLKRTFATGVGPTTIVFNSNTYYY